MALYSPVYQVPEKKDYGSLKTGCFILASPLTKVVPFLPSLMTKLLVPIFLSSTMVTVTVTVVLTGQGLANLAVRLVKTVPAGQLPAMAPLTSPSRSVPWTIDWLPARWMGFLSPLSSEKHFTSLSVKVLVTVTTSPVLSLRE